MSFQTVMAIVLGKKRCKLYFPLKNCELHKKHLNNNNNNKLSSFLGAWSENKYKVYVICVFTIPLSRTFHKL